MNLNYPKVMAPNYFLDELYSVLYFNYITTYCNLILNKILGCLKNKNIIQ